jgi:hypothetical protein
MNIDNDFINEIFSENSFPQILLSSIINENNDPMIVNLAYDLIEEARK